MTDNRLRKLTDDQVREIRARYAAGESQASLARAYKITDVAVFYIRTRRNYKHVE